MMKYVSIAMITMGLVIAFAAISPCAAQSDKPWSPEKAWEWYNQQPWIVGCNFLPSTAVNDVEMWQAETFDPSTIDRELGLAKELGFNSVRVFLNYVVWKVDPDGLRKRFEQFLELADQHGIRVMPIFFDDCAFAGKEPVAGKQADPVPGVHNSGWVPSPGKSLVVDKNTWPDLEKYVKDILGSFREDRRIIIWDLYNEPANGGMGENSRPLLEAVFKWARAMKPAQPLTVGAWVNFGDPIQRRMMELSDIISFHGYDAPAGIEAKIKVCGEYGRPVVCTEWLLRQENNRFETLLPMFRERKIGCYNWGLVAGRTQTYLHGNSKKGDPPPAVWQHDIFRPDGTPYNADEVALIKQVTGRQKVSSAKPSRVEVAYPDGRPSAPLRMEAKDQGIILRHGDGPGQCDYLGAREALIFEENGIYHLFYDGAGPKGWLACLATSRDLKTWEKKGPILDLGEKGRNDSAGACSPWVIREGNEWHMFYLGTPNASPAPNFIPSFPYLTMKAKSASLAGPWTKQPDVVPFACKPNAFYSVTASPGHIVKQGGEHQMFFSAAATGPKGVRRTLGIARTRDLNGPWAIDAQPIVAPEEQVENSSLYFEPTNKTWFLFTNHIGLDGGEYTDAIWVYWSKDLNKWDPAKKAVVLDGQNCTWSKKCIGMPSVIKAGSRLAIFYDAPGGGSTSHMKRDIGLAWLELPLSPPTPHAVKKGWIIAP